MKILVAVALLLTLPACSKSDASGQSGEPGQGQGRTLIQNKGSDTMLEVAQGWAEAYADLRTDVGVAVAGGGSQVGVTGLIDGTVDIANCSRAFKPEEIEAARKKNHEPVQHMVGYDGIAIYVHKDNPIAEISTDQLKSIYADGGTITKWSQLGVKLPSGEDDMVLVSRQSNSGTYEYFREGVLGKTTNFRLGTRDMNGSKDVVDLVSKVTSGIGYSGLSYATDQVRMVPVINKDKKAVTPSIDAVLDGSYPIARPLFMYTIGEPKGEVAKYLDWIKSDAGQRILMQKGYPPLRKI
ncbi:MAG: phosphate ABC transporter substrate-binding protein [Planctomycetota bacterium]